MPGQGPVERPKGVDSADIVGEPRTRPLYIHFAFGAQGEADHFLPHPLTLLFIGRRILRMQDSTAH